jgi:hypothetical protein
LPPLASDFADDSAMRVIQSESLFPLMRRLHQFNGIAIA